jgi:hypothetical protein
MTVILRGNEVDGNSDSNRWEEKNHFFHFQLYFSDLVQGFPAGFTKREPVRVKEFWTSLHFRS